MKPLERVREDFDRIARLVAARPERPDPFDAFLLAQIPPTCAALLEIGCGTGRLARAIAARGVAVTAIDVSPEMIRVARERAGGDPPLRFLCGDFMTWPIEDAAYDAVLSAATLHHLDEDEALARMKTLVRPGGVVILHDVRAASGYVDWLRSGLAALATGDAYRWLTRRLGQGGELHAAWLRHGEGERYLTAEEARELCRRQLPGAALTCHPLWRYTAVWTRPTTAGRLMDAGQLQEFGRRYAAAWCSQNAASVAAFFSAQGSLKINDGAPHVGRAAITSAAQAFMTDFPDMVVTMNDVSARGEGAVFRWTLTGTNTGPGGRGRSVRISGHEEWMLAADGLIAASKGHFDEEDYRRQLFGGTP